MSPDAHTRSVLARWLREDRRFAIALLVDVEGSAPLDPGAMMLIGEDLSLEGSLTGGCVEGALVVEAQRVIDGGADHLSTFGFSDELAGTVGLMCGGNVTVFITRPTKQAAQTLIPAIEAIESGRPVALAVLIDGDEAGAWMGLIDGVVSGELGGRDLLNASVARDLPALAELGHAQIRRYGPDGTVLGVGTSVFVRSFLEPPKLIIFGATDFSAATASFATELGYEVTICDPRPLFAASSRYASAATITSQWPDQVLKGVRLGPRDAVLAFTHDPKLDEPAIRAALATDVGYIGALGSRRTAAERERRLRTAGVSEVDLARVISPSGHDIGAGTPAETALSILAEIVARRHRRRGGPLSDSAGPIRAKQRDYGEGSVTSTEIVSSSATRSAPNSTV
jgi:xanthine dehydrogenase accessory factor